jgi:putative flippase GtrA
MSFLQYTRFLTVGAFVAFITVGSREVIGRLLGADIPVLYSLSVLMAYAIGMLLSFLLNQKFTFNKAATSGWKTYIPFIGIALLGMLLTSLISLALRYGLHFESLLGKYSAAASFAGAALLTSCITYPLNALLIFGQRSSATET